MIRIGHFSTPSALGAPVDPLPSAHSEGLIHRAIRPLCPTPPHHPATTHLLQRKVTRHRQCMRSPWAALPPHRRGASRAVPAGSASAHHGQRCRLHRRGTSHGGPHSLALSLEPHSRSPGLHRYLPAGIPPHGSAASSSGSMSLRFVQAASRCCA
jgi:hypothetical protein